jgi:hypothetical protein
VPISHRFRSRVLAGQRASPPALVALALSVAFGPPGWDMDDGASAGSAVATNPLPRLNRARTAPNPPEFVTRKCIATLGGRRAWYHGRDRLSPPQEWRGAVADLRERLPRHHGRMDSPSPRHSRGSRNPPFGALSSSWSSKLWALATEHTTPPTILLGCWFFCRQG